MKIAPILAKSCSPGPKGSLTAMPITEERKGAMKPRVSLCIIVKNEEANLADCLRSVAGLVDEMVIVDTGSSDRTKEIAHEFGARVFDFPWVDSFAAARNESIRHATGDWIFWMDADDRLFLEAQAKLKTLIGSLGDDNAGFCMKCFCLASPRTVAPTVLYQIRLFRNHPEIRWKYRVHEQILPAIRALKGTVRFTDIVINHTGYLDPEHLQRKQQRNLHLLELERIEQPDEPFTLFNMGFSYLELHRPAEALPLLRRSLELCRPNASIVRKLYALIAYCHRAMRQSLEALAACRAGLVHYPADVELQFLHGDLLAEQGDAAGAEEVLLRLIDSKEDAHYGSVSVGLQSYRAHYLLSTVYHRQGRVLEQEAHLRAALAEEKDFLPAVVSLGELFLKQQRWPEVDELATNLEKAAPTQLKGHMLRARTLLARGQFDPARQLLEAMVAVHPNKVWPRLFLGYVLLQEGRGWPAAEKVQGDILAPYPSNQEVKSGLGVLLLQLGKALTE
jgi:glycosyltransferase involved in cell wall biosynthesis